MLRLIGRRSAGTALPPSMTDHFGLLAAYLLSGQDILDALRSLVGLPETVFQGYSSLVRWAADSVHRLFESYGYWVIFLGTLSENTLLLGLVVPGVFVVILAGVAAGDGTLSLPVALALGIAGTAIGDTISYFVGRAGWSRLGRSSSLRAAADKMREPIMRKGMVFVLLYHFAGYTRLIGPAGAGALNIPYRRWAPADYAGATLWITVYMAAGYGLGLAGLSLESTNGWFRVLEWGLLVLVLIYGLYMYRAAVQLWSGQADKEEERGHAEEEREPVAAAQE